MNLYDNTEISSDSVSCDAKDSIDYRIAEARKELINNFFMTNYIVLFENRLIMAQYAEIVGSLDMELARLDYKLARSAKKLAFIKSTLSFGQALINSRIETIVDAQTEKQLTELKTKEKLFQGKLEFMELVDTTGEASLNEIHECYKTLVKRLNPDITGHKEADDLRIYVLAQKAYQSLDIDQLRALVSITNSYDYQKCNFNAKSKSEDSLDLELLLINLEKSAKKLEKIKGCHPYTLKEQLEDPKWMSQKRSELENKIAITKKSLAETTNVIDELLSGVGTKTTYTKDETRLV